MSIKVEVESYEIVNFSSGAKDQLSIEVKKYADEIIRESERLEESMRIDTNTPEITRLMVQNAVSMNTTLFNKKNTPKSKVIIQLISVLTLFLSGLVFDMSAFQTSIIKLIIFLVLVTTAITTTVIHILVGEDK